MSAFDAIDRKILAALQIDSRITMQELAEKVGLSISPCHRRVKLLEERGVITRYMALWSIRNRSGCRSASSSPSSLSGRRRKTSTVSPKAISKWEEVLECYLMTGNRDYLLRVVAADLSSYEAFLKNKLTRLDGIASIRIQLRPQPGEVFDRTAGVRAQS